MGMINFGSGKIVAVPTNASDGSVIATPNAVVMGTLQDVTVDLSTELKTLYGSGRFPIAVGQGKGKIEIKAKYAELDAGIVGSLFLGKTPAAGIKAAVFDSAGTIPSSAAYELTVSPPNSGAFISDLGVFRADVGAQLNRVATGATPVTGEYKVDANGKYTFAAADAGKPVKISYEYSATTGGKIWTITNDQMGFTPSFNLLLQNDYDGKKLVCRLYRAVSGKLALPFKNDEFGIYDFDAQAFANGAGDIGYICMVGA